MSKNLPRNALLTHGIYVHPDIKSRIAEAVPDLQHDRLMAPLIADKDMWDRTTAAVT